MFWFNWSMNKTEQVGKEKNCFECQRESKYSIISGLSDIFLAAEFHLEFCSLRSTSELVVEVLDKQNQLVFLRDVAF